MTLFVKERTLWASTRFWACVHTNSWIQYRCQLYIKHIHRFSNLAARSHTTESNKRTQKAVGAALSWRWQRGDQQTRHTTNITHVFEDLAGLETLETARNMEGDGQLNGCRKQTVPHHCKRIKGIQRFNALVLLLQVISVHETLPPVHQIKRDVTKFNTEVDAPSQRPSCEWCAVARANRKLYPVNTQNGIKYDEENHQRCTNYTSTPTNTDRRTQTGESFPCAISCC